MDLVEIVETIHGELPYMGLPCLLVRFAGCNLKCPYCDTNFEKRFEKPTERVAEFINSSRLPSVLLTGGEPLLQKEFETLVSLIRKDIQVVVETNGSILIPETLYGNVTWVIDVKLHESMKNIELLNLPLATVGDVFKFVFWDEKSFDDAVEFLKTYQNKVSWGVNWVFSPTHELVVKKKIEKYVAEIISLQKEVEHRKIWFQTQIHKILGVK